MREVADLKKDLNDLFPSGILAGIRVVITAGPTQEALDPVRYMTNHSSGKMGYALAEAAQDAGASVCLISGPTHLAPPGRVRLTPVISALEMHKQALQETQDCDIFIAAAAVADYRPAEVAREKIKKQASGDLSIRLVKNPDIVAEVKMHHPEIFVAGFAAETQSLLAHARDKLQGKNLDLIIANDVSVSGIGFNSEQNAVSVLSRHTPELRDFQPMTKSVLARHLIQLIAAEYRLFRAP
jgi:phosphopantothenoylcysteine decarboxylase/phosphopantothenate--cysteine ligase